MNDTPFSPGGIIPSGGPGSDLITALILKVEVIGVPHLVRD